MKKILTILIGAACAVGCSGNSAKTTESADSTATAQETGERTLVAYFSATGTTANAARLLSEQIPGSTLFEILPETPYSDADLDWHDKQSRSSVEMADSTSRPAIAAEPVMPDMAEFDTVYVGFPIWWYTCPTIINTFIESVDLRGKTVIPFATSGGSTIEGTVANLRRDYPELTIEEGLLLNGATPQSVASALKK